MDNRIIPYKWCLWTVWSMNLEKWKKESTTQDFVEKVIDAVDRHDKKFARTVFSAVGNRDEIIVIQPKKLKVGPDQLEIVGPMYKPGNDYGGKRWTLIAVDDLKEVFMADSKMISSNGIKDLFIILGGHIDRSGQQILLNKTNPSKVIRVIGHNSARPKTERVLGFSVSLFKCPYDSYRGPPGSIQDVTFRLDKTASTTVLKTFPSLPPTEIQTSENSISITPVKMRNGPSEQSARPPPTQEALEYSSSPEIEIVYSSLPNDQAGADSITPRPATTDTTGPRVATPPPMTPPITKDLRLILHRLKIHNLTARIPVSKDDNNERVASSPANNNSTEPRLDSNRPKITTDLRAKTSTPKTSAVDPNASTPKRTTPLSKSKRPRAEENILRGGFFPEEEDDDYGDVDPNVVLPRSTPSSTFPKWRKIDFGKQTDKENYKYFTLHELEGILLKQNKKENTHYSTLKNVSIWAAVRSVTMIPEETPNSPAQFVHPPRAATYTLEVSDETKSNVLIRLCTNVRNNTLYNSNHLVGPRIKPTDIIRIHRATAQWEKAVMVISATPHSSYSLFNFDSNVDGPIVVQRLAKKTLELRNDIVQRVHKLREFIGSEETLPSSLFSNDEFDFRTTQEREDDENNVTIIPPNTDSVTIIFATPTLINTCDSTTDDIYEDATGDQVIDSLSQLHGTEQSQTKTLHPRSSRVGLLPGTSQSSGEMSVYYTFNDDMNGYNTDSQPDSQLMMPLTFAQRSELLAQADSQADFTVEEVISCIRADALPTKLSNVSGQLKSAMLHAKIIHLVETTKDELIVRISDGTRVQAPIKKLIPHSLDDHPERDSDDPPFVDLLLTNISDSPDVRRRMMAGVRSGKKFLFTFVNVVKAPGSSEIELRVKASTANTHCLN